MGHKGHWGEYTGNAKWSRDHAHTRVTSKNYDDAVKDDAAHIDYLKEILTMTLNMVIVMKK